MKCFNEQKIKDKITSLIPRALNVQFNFDQDSEFFVSFSLSDVIIPNKNPEYFSLKTLNVISKEFGDSEILIRTGINNDIILGIIVNNQEYYET